MHKLGAFGIAFLVSLVLVGSIVGAVLSSDLNYTMVMGKVYDGTISSPVADATVYIDCNTHSVTRTSLSDASFGYAYAVSDCGKDNILSVKAVANGRESYQEITLPSYCSPSGCVAIVNIDMSGASSSIVVQESSGTYNGGGGGGSSSSPKTLVVASGSVCGNRVCEPDENETSCSFDCNSDAASSDNVDKIDASGDNVRGGISGITGAVIGAFGGMANFFGVVVFIVALIAAFIGVRMVRMNSSSAPAGLKNQAKTSKN